MSVKAVFQLAALMLLLLVSSNAHADLACSQIVSDSDCVNASGCQWCNTQSRSFCRDATLPCTCYNGQYDAGEEGCENDLTESEACENCSCVSPYEPDGNGECEITQCSDYPSGDGCQADEDCKWCAAEQTCIPSSETCSLCLDIDENDCANQAGCYWCRNKTSCLNDGESCTCGDGYLLLNEQCDDGIDPEHCVDCECVAGFKPDSDGGCKPTCDPPCENGWCTDVNVCSCHMGWEGDTCAASACGEQPCALSCSDYDKDNCSVHDTCQWCRSTSTCMGVEETCPGCADLPDETSCLASDSYCQYCSEASTDLCRRTNMPCTCGNGQFDPDDEACEDDLGDSDCNNCQCSAGTEPNHNGGCVASGYDSCNAHSASESTCHEYSDCHFCEVEGLCKNVERECILCENLGEEYCEYGLTCYWCRNKTSCLNDGESCTCGDGYLLLNEQCDDGIDPEHCVDCLCTTGYYPEPTHTGACRPVCDPACIEGTCTAPNNCDCNNGWVGEVCDQQTCYPECNPAEICEPWALVCYDPEALVINEIDVDQPGTDSAEFVELKNKGESSIYLSDYLLVMIDATGEVHTTIALDEVWLDAGDYFVVCSDSETVAECDQVYDSVSNFIVDGAPSAVALFLGNTLIDTLSYEGDSTAPYTEGSGVGLEDPDSLYQFGLSRYPDGSDTDENNVDFSGHCITPGMENTVFSEHCTCGDETVDDDLGEECDDGNRDNIDGCDQNCQIETDYCESEGDYRCVENVLQNCDQNLWTDSQDCSETGLNCAADGSYGECLESDGDLTDGDVTDGDVTDGDVTDGDVTDGDVIDGDLTDGDVTDGDVIDGDAIDGDVIDGDVTDGDVTDGDVTDGDVTDREVTDGDLADGDVIDSDLEEDTSDAELTDGDLIDGSLPDGDEPIDGDGSVDGDASSVDGDDNSGSGGGGCQTPPESGAGLWLFGLAFIALAVIRRRKYLQA